MAGSAGAVGQGGTSAGGSAATGGSDAAGEAGAPFGGMPAQSGGAPSTSGGTAGAGGALASPLRAFRLRAELQNAPVGVQTPVPRLSWAFEGVPERGLTQTAYELLVATTPEKLQAGDGDLWSSGPIESSESLIRYAGKALGSFARAHWKVRVRDHAARWSTWSPGSELTVGVLSAADWGAQWLSAAAGPPLPIFRREFSVSKPVRRALAAVCGLGQFELRINGKNATDAVMEPSWTNFSKSCAYSVYDVTAQLVQGPNALGMMLGNGMYNVPVNERYTKFTGSFGPLKFILRLQLELADGTSEAVVSDASWKVAPGPVTFTNIYGGEDYDARRDPSGWDQPSFDDTSWAAASVLTTAAQSLVARSAPPVKVMQEFAAPRITEPASGVFVYDLGQNFAGWPQIVVEGAAGSTVKLTPGETLTGGRVSQAGSGSPVYFSYTLKGGGPESWRPRFTYHGFRYIQVEGAVPAAEAARFPGQPQLTSLKGQFIHSSAEAVGKFTSSDADLNRIHALILAAIRSNLQHVLTDCPHREKLGWLETSHLLAPSIMFNYDVGAFYEKLIRDAADAQTASGLIPNIAPELTVFSGNFRDSPEWGSAFVVNPWHVYQMYGVREPLTQHYANMKRYVSYLGSKATANILSYGLGDWYDVGPNPPGVSQLTTAGVTGTAIWLQDLQVLEQAARLLGNEAEATQFRASQVSITSAYNARFLNAGRYDRGSQTANGMPLALGLVPEAQRAAVLAALVTSISGSANRVTAGDVGFAYVIRALSQSGRGDLVYALMKQSMGPGYLYQISRGATSLTEAWDAFPNSSQNHAMLGHAEEWLYNGLAGINPDASGSGFKKFFVRPTTPAGVASVDVEYQSMRGLVVSKWARNGAGLTLTVSVPPNTTATIVVPTSMPSAVTESGVAVAEAPGVLSSTPEGNSLRVGVASGQYVFAAP